MKFNGTDGSLTITSDKTDDLIGLEVVVDTRNIFHGFTRWIDGKRTASAIVRISQPKPDRSKLGDLDETEWQVVDKVARDPWGRLATYVPMMRKEEDGIYVFITDSISGINAVKNLIGVYANKIHEKGDADRLPIIRIGRESFISKYRGKLWAPVFDLLAWRVVDWKDFSDSPERKEIEAPEKVKGVPREPVRPMPDTPASRYDDDRENRRRGKATVQTASGKIVDKRRRERDDSFDDDIPI